LVIAAVFVSVVGEYLVSAEVVAVTVILDISVTGTVLYVKVT
jgi:hypothetical protein